MFVSIEQLEQSLRRLEQIHPFFGMSLLIFARERVPVGLTKELVLGRLATELLDDHYKASAAYSGYYSPFLASSARGRWVKKGYNHTTLQRITTDTFGDVTLHPTGTSEWGWTPGYIAGLRRHLDGRAIPAFDMAVWLFRNHEWPSKVQAGDLPKKLFADFHIGGTELQQLFDPSVPELASPWIAKNPVSERHLFRVIGYPPGSAPEEGAALELLELREVGPASKIDYEPADRLNIITGDNSLGKTFLLECIWWALTGEWLERPALPRMEPTKKRPAAISFVIKTSDGSAQRHLSKFDLHVRDWSTPKDRKVLPGLVIYARHDGSFAVWDPAKVRLAKTVPTEAKPWILLDKDKLWNGLSIPSRLGEEYLCNGLVIDWVQWQLAGDRYKDQFAALVACLKTLSPSEDEPLRPGEPRRWFPRDTREAPTLQMPYGPIPARLASAGVQRIIGIAYVLVWAWFEHLATSNALQSLPQRRLVFLIDEAEAHLHPKWQRVIVPAIHKVIGILSEEITPQVHLATHSPMVMASTETIFDGKKDKLHHLQLVGADVQMEELPYVRRGTVDQWLISPVFDMRQARSVPAEQAIERAKGLQASDQPDPQQVREVQKLLERVLAPDDEFWPRWRYFATMHGGEP